MAGIGFHHKTDIFQKYVSKWLIIEWGSGPACSDGDGDVGDSSYLGEHQPNTIFNNENPEENKFSWENKIEQRENDI